MKTRKLLFVDTETTGLSPDKNDIHQIAIVVRIDSRNVLEKTYYARPINWDEISEKALETANVTLDKIKNYPVPKKAYVALRNDLNKYIDRYDKFDKFRAVGYNVRFDLNMLDAWFKKLGDKFFYSYIAKNPKFDMYELVKVLANYTNFGELENLKLTTVCEHCGIDLENAHDAMGDIKATETLFDLLCRYLNFNPSLKELFNEKI